MLKKLGLPGWSCTRQIDSWMDAPMDCIDHFEQLQALDDPELMKKWIPNEDWVLVTWSMGTKLGVALSDYWTENPPKCWIALSPFLHFVGPDSANKIENVDALKKSLLAKPESAIKLFTRGHGVREPWMNLELSEQRVQTLAQSLDTLCEPIDVNGKNFDVPIYCFCGTKDSLVNEWMVKEFAEATCAQEVCFLEKLSHAIFYEEPKALHEKILELNV